MKSENREKSELIHDLQVMSAKLINQAQLGQGLPSCLHGLGRVKASLDEAFTYLSHYEVSRDPKHLEMAEVRIRDIAQLSMRLSVMIDNHRNDPTRRPKG